MDLHWLIVVVIERGDQRCCTAKFTFIRVCRFLYGGEAWLCERDLRCVVGLGRLYCCLVQRRGWIIIKTVLRFYLFQKLHRLNIGSQHFVTLEALGVEKLRQRGFFLCSKLDWRRVGLFGRRVFLDITKNLRHHFLADRYFL